MKDGFESYDKSIVSLLIHFLISEISEMNRESDENINEKISVAVNNIMGANIFNFMHTTINSLTHIERFKFDPDLMPIITKFTELNLCEEELYIGNLEMLNDITFNLTKSKKDTFGEYIRQLKSYYYISETKILHYRDSNFLKLYQNHNLDFEFKYLSQITKIEFFDSLMPILIKASEATSNNKLKEMLKMFDKDILKKYSKLNDFVTEFKFLLNIKSPQNKLLHFEGFKSIFLSGIYKLIYNNDCYFENFVSNEKDILIRMLQKSICQTIETTIEFKGVINEMEAEKSKILFDGIDNQRDGSIFESFTKINNSILNIKISDDIMTNKDEIEKYRKLIETGKFKLEIELFEINQIVKTDKKGLETKTNEEVQVGTKIVVDSDTIDNSQSIVEKYEVSNELVQLREEHKFILKLDSIEREVHSTKFEIVYGRKNSKFKMISFGFKGQTHTVVN